MGDRKYPKSLKDILGAGYKKRLGLPPYGTLPPIPEGGLLSPYLPVPPPEVDPEPPEASAEEKIDARLAAALASLENDDSSIH